MDPAVVAVSSFVPPPISQNSSGRHQRSAFTSAVAPLDNAPHHSGRSDSVTVTIDDEINEWNAKPGFINSENKEVLDDGNLLVQNIE